MTEAHDFIVYMYQRTYEGDFTIEWRCVECGLEVATTADLPSYKTPPIVSIACGQRCGQPVENRR